jgi:catechol 2,3-dioxygenase-like lactoylglutathione lyase family enzyme
MKFVCALITVKEIKQARYFYETILGQKVIADYGENITFEGDFALHQEAHFKTLIDNRTILQNANNFELYFEENDLDSLYTKLVLHNIEFIHPVREQPWRQRVMRFYDYDKNIVEAGESLEYTAYRMHKEGKSTGQIAKVIYFTENQVLDAIRTFE